MYKPKNNLYERQFSIHKRLELGCESSFGYVISMIPHFRILLCFLKLKEKNMMNRINI